MIPVKTTLFINGISSGATGIGLIAFAGPVAGLFRISPAAIFTEVGIFLVFFSALVIFSAFQKSGDPRWVNFITTLDVLWVAASLLVVVVAGQSMSIIGIVATVAVAAWVGLMAYLQIRGLRVSAG